MNGLRQRTEYLGVRATLNLVALMPEPLTRVLFRGLALGYFLVGRRRRRLTLTNLRAALPELPARRRLRLALGTYLHVSEVALHSARMLCRLWTEAELDAQVDDDAAQRLLALEAEHEKGLMIVSAHLGDWEFMGRCLARTLRRPKHLVARRSDNRLIEEDVVRRLRGVFNTGIIYKKGAGTAMVRALLRGEHVGILIDQKLSRKQGGIETDFFGRPALAVSAPAALALRYDIPVVPVFLFRTGRNRYRLEVDGPVDPPAEGQPERERIADLTQRLQKIIEEKVREHPEQWFWMHDRWRPSKKTKRAQENVG
ncbi:lysophospholipid acyltransferase family protein [Kiritimatiella glycovorans]|uniref:Lipid A biosynthesis lauroyl acyltransferase n=1 Tax=Kiritimatiella glycovorans TaxID=1307763 RepID=A0A0G3EGA9_9BACT|nr:lysophospholipid acyltransferase family protein [Kiritimatiella glycovorans]AKJ64442.1 Lipid A biosynthesis lauroyl acyltransferase [Kiritimatiella glycovorans]